MPSASSKSSQVAQPNVVVDLLQEPMKNAVSVADKKLRNLEKRKLKLLDTKKKADSGQELNEDQKKALELLHSVDYSLDTVKDVQKSLASLELEHAKLVKKEQKRIKQEQKDQADSQHHQVVLKAVEIQAILGELSEEVRPDFLSGSNGACALSESDFENLDAIYELINPAASEEKDNKLSERVKVACEHLTNLIESKNKPAVDSVTYKDINDILKKILNCGYFDKDNTNGQKVETTPVPVADAAVPEEERPDEPAQSASPVDDESPEDEFPPSEFQETPTTLEAPPAVVPVNGVDLPPEVQETPEDESINFMGESEITTATQEVPSLNPVSPEFVPRNLQSSQDENTETSGDSNWQQVESGQNYQQNRGRGRGGRGGGNYRGRGRGGNYRGGQRDGNYRGGNRGGRGGERGGRDGNYRGGNRDGNYRGGQRDGQRDGRGGGRGRGGRGGGFGQPQQQQQ